MYFYDFPQNPALKCKLWTTNSFWKQISWAPNKGTTLHLSGHFLKLNKKKLNLKSNVFTLKTDKDIYFSMENTVYPYENILEIKGNYFSLSMNDYTDVLYFIENNEFAHL